jgi:stage V sporulation protein S
MAEEEQQVPVAEYDGRMVFVSAKDEAKGVARKITGAALEGAIHGFPVYLFGVRSTSINIATKAVAVARSMMAQNNTEIVCEVSFRENRNEVTTKVMKFDDITAQIKPCEKNTDLTVGSKSKISVVAGAIAGQIRDGSSVNLTGVGPNAVFNAVRSIAVARDYLKQRGDPIDLLFQPEFVEIQLEGRDGTTNAMKLCVIPVMVSSGIDDPAIVGISGAKA